MMMRSKRRVRFTSVISLAVLLAASGAEAARWSVRGPEGRAWSGTAIHANNGGGNVGRTVTMTGPDGRTATGSYARSNVNGTITSDHAYTGPNGGTANRTLTRTPGQGGTVTTTGPNGGSSSASWSP